MPNKERCIHKTANRRGEPCFEVSKYWPDGSRFRRQFPTVTIAKNIKARIEEALAMGTWRALKQELYEDPKQDLTIAQFSEVYLEEYCRLHNSRPDFKETTLKTIVAIVGDVRVKEFARPHAKFYEAERAKSVIGATVNRGIAVLSHMLTFAMEKGLITIHPMDRYSRIPEEERAMRVMSLEEERKLVLGVLKEDVAVGVYCGVMGETALRPEEGLRLEWPFINISQKLLTVDRAKGKRARHIRLSDFAIELLRMLPRVVGIPHVIVRLDTFQRVKDARGPFQKARHAAQMDWVGFRDFRHFRASQWVQGGADLRAVQGLMGHRDIRTTMRYAHFAESHAHQSVEQVYEREAASLAQLSMNF